MLGRPAESDTVGAKVAGAALIVNALLAFASFAVIPATEGGALMRSPLPGLIDLAIGGSLLTGEQKYKTWAIVRVVLGALLYGGVSLSQGLIFVACCQFA